MTPLGILGIVLMFVMIGCGLGYLRWKKRKEQTLAPSRLRASVSGRGGPSQHYIFAHRMLKDLIFADARAFSGLTKMARDGVADGMLERMWATAGDMARQMGGATGGSPPRARLIEDGVFVRMPPPRQPAEAHSIAILGRLGRIRYFTLEKAGPPTQAPFMLCEWTKDTHANLGPFSDGSEEGLLANVRRRAA